MQGPHAFANTTPPTFSNSFINPSRSIVNRTNSLPGVIVNSDCAFSPLPTASLTIEALRLISSYEEFVQLPIRATSNFSGQPFAFTASAIFETGVARSGVKGPFTYG